MHNLGWVWTLHLLKHFYRGFNYSGQVELCLGAAHQSTLAVCMWIRTCSFLVQHQTIFSLLYAYEINFILYFPCINRNIIFVISKKILDLKTIFAKILYLPPFRSAANPNMIYRMSLLPKGIVATEIMNYLKVTFNLLPKKQASIAQGCWGNRKAALDQFAAEKTCWYFAIWTCSS